MPLCWNSMELQSPQTLEFGLKSKCYLTQNKIGLPHSLSLPTLCTFKESDTMAKKKKDQQVKWREKELGKCKMKTPKVRRKKMTGEKELIWL